MKYQIQARALYDNEPGWESSGRQCPTFYVQAASSEEAAKKAADALNPYNIPGYRLRIVVGHSNKKDRLYGAAQFWNQENGELRISNPYPGEAARLEPVRR